MKPLTSF